MNEQILANRPAFPAQLDMSHPLSNKLVGCWLLNGGGLRAFDSSPKANHGTASGAKIKYDGARFNGTSDYITLPSNIVTSGNWSIVIVLKGIAASPEGAAEAVSFDNGGGGIYYGGNTHATRWGLDTGVGTNANTLISETDQKIRMLGMSFRTAGTLNSFYYNGKPDGSFSQALPYMTTNSAIGNDRGSVGARFYLNAFIYGVFVWRRLLTDREFLNMYIDPYQMFLR